TLVNTASATSVIAATIPQLSAQKRHPSVFAVVGYTGGMLRVMGWVVTSGVLLLAASSDDPVATTDGAPSCGGRAAWVGEGSAAARFCGRFGGGGRRPYGGRRRRDMGGRGGGREGGHRCGGRRRGRGQHGGGWQHGVRRRHGGGLQQRFQRGRWGELANG